MYHCLQHFQTFVVLVCSKKYFHIALHSEHTISSTCNLFFLSSLTQFDPKTPLDKSNAGYIKNPTSNDKARILVFVLAVDIIHVGDQQMFKKMTEIRLAARDLGDIKCYLVA